MELNMILEDRSVVFRLLIEDIAKYLASIVSTKNGRQRFDVKWKWYTKTSDFYNMAAV